MIHFLTTVAAVMALWVGLGAVVAWAFGRIADATLEEGHDAE